MASVNTLYRNRDQDVYDYVKLNPGSTFAQISGDVSTPNAEKTAWLLGQLQKLGLIRVISDITNNEARYWTVGETTGWIAQFWTSHPTALTWIDDPLNNGKTEIDLAAALNPYGVGDLRNECIARLFSYYFEVEASGRTNAQE